MHLYIFEENATAKVKSTGDSEEGNRMKYLADS